MNQQQNQSQGSQSQRQGSRNPEPDQQQQGLPEQSGQGPHLVDEDDRIPGSDPDEATDVVRQLEQSDSNRSQQDDKPRTGSEAERI
jgi:hypothetical protein